MRSELLIGVGWPKTGRVLVNTAILVQIRPKRLENWAYNRTEVADMSLRDNKMAVLRQLGLESEATGLSNLLEKLGGAALRNVRSEDG